MNSEHGKNGRDGENGRNGKDGRDGRNGRNGKHGRNEADHDGCDCHQRLNHHNEIPSNVSHTGQPTMPSFRQRLIHRQPEKMNFNGTQQHPTTANQTTRNWQTNTPIAPIPRA